MQQHQLLPHLQVFVEVVAHDEVVCHAHAVRLHGVRGAVVKVAKVGIVKVRHLRHSGVQSYLEQGSGRTHGLQWCGAVVQVDQLGIVKEKTPA
jgi:hypothetical protein